MFTRSYTIYTRLCCWRPRDIATLFQQVYIMFLTETSLWMALPSRPSLSSRFGSQSDWENREPQVPLFQPLLTEILKGDYWGDGTTFRPERFLDCEGRVRRDDHLIPFSIGKRQCLGETLAKVSFLLSIYGVSPKNGRFIFWTHFRDRLFIYC